MKDKRHIILWSVVVLLIAAFGAGRFAKASRELPRQLLFSHSFGQKHPIHKFLADFARQIETESQKNIKVTIYDSSQLGAEPQFVEQIRLGALDGGIVSNQGLARFAPDFLVLQYPYVFLNEAQVRQFLNTSGEEYLKNELNKARCNLKLFCSLTNGMNGLYFTDDAGSFMHAERTGKFYLAFNGHPIYKKFFEQQGLISVPIAKGEIYSALQMKMLHTGENTLAGLIGSKHHETAKFFVATDHSAAVFFLVMNSKKLDSFSEKEQIMLTNAWKKAKAAFEKKKAVDRSVLAAKNNITLQIPADSKQKEWREKARKLQTVGQVPWNRSFYNNAENFGAKVK